MEASIGRARLTLAVALTIDAACLAWAAVSIGSTQLWLLVALAVVAAAANFAESSLGSESPHFLSGAFLAYMLAAGILGGQAAFIVVLAAEVSAWALRHTRPVAAILNVAALGAPFILAGVALQALGGWDPHSWTFFAGLAVAGALALVLNLILLDAFSVGVDGTPPLSTLPAARAFAPSLGINIVLLVAAAGVYAEIGPAGLVFALFTIVAFTYMAHLVAKARERARQYASLSWGVLSGLLRALDARDPRAARHSAATAAFARDIARHCGMDERTCELAHTAGLLHDVGRLVLADRVLDRGRTLNEEDWDSIRRHPALGAEMLQDLGVYGPVAEIVRAHHERIDGRGYPDGTPGERIPDLAKIVAVAEVYDTLTAEDTYRTQVSSFEALTELRRVSGTQLEGRYVEALADLLSGRGVEYRHASGADFERELDMERRIGDAATG